MKRRTHAESDPETLVEVTAGPEGFYTEDRLFIPAGGRTTTTLRKARELFLSGQIVEFTRA